MYRIERVAITVATSHERNQKKKNPSRYPTFIETKTKEINAAVMNAIITANLISFFERRQLINVNVQKTLVMVLSELTCNTACGCKTKIIHTQTFDVISIVNDFVFLFFWSGAVCKKVTPVPLYDRGY
jgi:hypothetical protein